MLHTSEQFATKQFMEGHDDVTQGVTSRQTDRRGRQAARSNTTDDEYLREDSRLGKHDRDAREDDPETRSQKTKAEVQSDAMHDRGPERRDA